MRDLLETLGLQETNPGAWTGAALTGDGPLLPSRSPGDGRLLGHVRLATADEYESVVAGAQDAFGDWRALPAPARGEIVRQFGNALRDKKEALGDLVSIEMGKIRTEGHGEVQEMIDICDFAVGLSRQLYGLTMHSERPQHRMYEQWHPLGVVGVISAFNFPVAVWAWNAAIAWVCGNTVVWKPSEKTPLTAIACQRIAHEVFARNGIDAGLSGVVVGTGTEIGERLTADRRIPLVSATGSTRMGRRVGRVVAERLGRTILELGGNNAIIVTPNADLELAMRAIAFGALGTAGQRCTTTRRVIAHSSVYEALKERLRSVYGQVRIGDPLEAGTLVGPLIDEDAVESVISAVQKVKEQGGTILCGGKKLEGCYIEPAIAEVDPALPIVKEETFGPLLYLMRYETFDEAIRIHNDVPQGLSSAIFTRDMREAERFLAHAGSDCGIANVNIGTSGAEIGGAFGGEKDTGGGRESGSDAWRAYMRRQTNTINWSTELPLAQGVEFDID
ncbi:MAG: aldehyde dehydrogenase family protein [Planctomycetota bacterium]|nr:aldehyde dehydrogenase family protein [Planctomycetota bacterium]